MTPRFFCFLSLLATRTLSLAIIVSSFIKLRSAKNLGVGDQINNSPYLFKMSLFPLVTTPPLSEDDIKLLKWGPMICMKWIWFCRLAKQNEVIIQRTEFLTGYISLQKSNDNYVINSKSVNQLAWGRRRGCCCWS